MVFFTSFLWPDLMETTRDPSNVFYLPVYACIMYFASSQELQKVLYFGQKCELFSKKDELKKWIIWLGATCRPDYIKDMLCPLFEKKTKQLHQLETFCSSFHICPLFDLPWPCNIKWHAYLNITFESVVNEHAWANISFPFALQDKELISVLAWASSGSLTMFVG